MTKTKNKNKKKTKNKKMLDKDTTLYTVTHCGTFMHKERQLIKDQAQSLWLILTKASNIFCQHYCQNCSESNDGIQSMSSSFQLY